MVHLKVCIVELVPPGSMKQFVIGDLEVLVANYSGQFFCLDARCTHAGAPLAEGTLNGPIITCPWHGSQFNIINGAVVRGPAQKNLKAYSTTIADGSVFIDT